MSTPPETPSPRRIAREIAGLLLTTVGVLVVLVVLGAVHLVLGVTAAAAGTLVSYRLVGPPKNRGPLLLSLASTAVANASAVALTFMYFPLLGWAEIGTAIAVTGIWLASEGA
ncbi:hypothetical protein GTY65_24260 [Streptomyces sp. SID8379]|uniref:hypothetical protein n=1 Tax=unclassified Streptomyces TaxID=2593676 RepID=UPI00131A26BC|nr:MULTISPECIES: hypothetical protein [unclassified Streptomyces]MYW67157.1 hypothetical protein [Streptomyces sp. SID8379]